jgi:RNA polymerase sigma-70 factor (ECF subfamily)
MGSIQTPAPGAAGAQKEASATLNTDIQMLVSQRFIDSYPRFYRLAYRYLGREADAQDAVQEAAYKAISRCRSLRSPEWIDTWLYRIVINESLSILRKNSRQSDGDDILEQIPTQDQYQDLDLRAAIARLDTLDQTIITLRFFEELKLDQIAAITRQPLSKVKSRLYRAMKKLRLSLTEEETQNE